MRFSVAPRGYEVGPLGRNDLEVNSKNFFISFIWFDKGSIFVGPFSFWARKIQNSYGQITMDKAVDNH